MSGDYPLENQPFWTDTFKSVAEAIPHARIAHAMLKGDTADTSIYTYITEDMDGESINWVRWQGHEFDDMKVATKLCNMLGGAD